MTVITKIPNLVRRNVKQGIKSQLDLIKSKGFVVKSITTDGGFACLKEWTHSRGINSAAAKITIADHNDVAIGKI
jgi:hypothetical protein